VDQSEKLAKRVVVPPFPPVAPKIFLPALAFFPQLPPAPTVIL